MRAVTDLAALGELQIKLDCDVIQARVAARAPRAITGGYVALHLACRHLVEIGARPSIPLTEPVAAVSCGLWQGLPVLDLDYAEDSSAQADANFVLTASRGIVEVQGTAEGDPFSHDQLLEMLRLAEIGTEQLVGIQKAAIEAAVA